MGDEMDEVEVLRKKLETMGAEQEEKLADKTKEANLRLDAVKKSNDESYRELELKLKELQARMKREAEEAAEKAAEEKSEMKNELTAQMEAAKTSLQAELDNALVEAKDAAGDMKTQLEEQKEIVAKTQAELNEIGSKMAEAAKDGPRMMSAASASLEEKQAAIKTLQARLDLLQIDTDEYKVYFDKSDETKTMLEETEKSLGETEEAKDELQKQVDELAGKISALEASLEEVEEEKKAAVESKESLSTTYDVETEESKKDILTKDATISELEGKIEDLESELTATKERGEKNMEEFSENIQGVRNAMAEELAAATGKAVTAETEIKKIKTEEEAIHTRLEKEIAEVKASLKDTENQKTELEEKLAAEQRTVAETRTEVEKLNEAIVELKTVVEDTKGEKATILAERKKIEADAKKESFRIEGELNVVKLEVETMKKTVERRDRELTKSQGSVKDIRDQLQAKGKTFDELKVTYEHTIAERDALSTQVEEITADFKKEMADLTQNYVTSRDEMTSRHGGEKEALNKTIADNEESNQNQLKDMTEARQKIETRNEELQRELLLIQRKGGEQAETIVKMSADLSRAMQNLEKNEKQFNQFAADLEAVGTLNESLKKDLEQRQTDWDTDAETFQAAREELSERIANLEKDVQAEQGKLAESRNEVTEKIALLEVSDADSTEKQTLIDDLNATVAQMEEAKTVAEALRDEIREQHKKDVTEGGEERDELAENIKTLSADLAETQHKLDELRQVSLEARQNYSEEKIRREAREGDIEKGKKREEKLQEAIEEKSAALATAKENAVASAETATEEMKVVQLKKAELEDKLRTADTRAEALMMEVSSFKAKEEEARATGDEGWAKAESEEKRRADEESSREKCETELQETQDGWKAEVASQEEEKTALVEKDEKLMQDLNEQRTKAEQESNKRLEEENVRKQKEVELDASTTEATEATERADDLETRFSNQTSKVAEMMGEMAQQKQLDADERKVLEVQIQKLQDDAETNFKEIKDLEDQRVEAEAAMGVAEGAKDSEADGRQLAENERDTALELQDGAQTELAEFTEATGRMQNDTQEKVDALQAEIDELKTKALALETDKEELNAKLETSTEELQTAKDSEEAAVDAQAELEHWKEDTTAEVKALEEQQEEEQEQFEQIVNHSATITSKAKADKEVAEKKLADAEAQAQAAATSASGAKEAEASTAKTLAIEKANGEALETKIKQLSKELEDANSGWSKAKSDKETERTKSTGLSEELALLKSQLSSATRSKDDATKLQEETETRNKSYEKMEAERKKLMDNLIKAYREVNEGRKTQSDTLTKMMGALKKAQSRVKSTEAAFEKSTNAAVRADTDEVAEMVKAMSGGWNDKAGVWMTDDVVKDCLSHTGGTDDFSKAAAAMEDDVKNLLAKGAVDPVALMRKGKATDAPDPTGPQFDFLEGALEVDKTGKGSSFKKRYFKLGQNSMTYASSSKPDAKMLGVVNLGGANVELKGATFKVTEAMNSAAKRVYMMKCKSAKDAAKWVKAIEKNVKNAK